MDSYSQEGLQSQQGASRRPPTAVGSARGIQALWVLGVVFALLAVLAAIVIIAELSDTDQYYGAGWFEYITAIALGAVPFAVVSAVAFAGAVIARSVRR